MTKRHLSYVQDMGIEATGMKDALSSLDNILDMALSTVGEAMELACMNVVAEARIAGTYTDRTSNLRSSIGFMIKDNGRVIAENFQHAGAGTADGSNGIAKAKSAAEKASMLYGDQLIAVIVAGEDYAVYVESKGFDVITGSMLHFADRFKQYFEAAGGNNAQVKIKKGVGNK